MQKRTQTHTIAILMVSNVIGGIGVASGISVGALLMQEMAGLGWAGVGQALSVLGAAIASVPLATMAAQAGRRRALTIGYSLATLGALIVITSAMLGWVPLLMVGLLLFGTAQASNLQSRYAASDAAAADSRARTMSLVVWATTIGSVLGPNLSSTGADMGRLMGLPGLAGPYVFSVIAFASAGVLLRVLLPTMRATADQNEAAEQKAQQRKALSAPAALKWASKHPVARFGVLLIAVSHAVMVGIMSMTPVHLQQHGQGLRVVGLVISLHILGMYALAPVFGWMADKIGAMRLAFIALVTLGFSAVGAWVSAISGSVPTNAAALILLGLGWSMALISSSALMASVDSGEVRLPLQGATDALMSYLGAAAALIGGPVVAVIGYGGFALAMAMLLVPAFVVGALAHRAKDTGFDPIAQR